MENKRVGMDNYHLLKTLLSVNSKKINAVYKVVLCVENKDNAPSINN